MSAINLNQTTADCLRTVRDIGSSTVMNICDGTSTQVPWGSGDWAFAILLAVMIGLVLGVFVGLFVSIVTDR